MNPYHAEVKIEPLSKLGSLLNPQANELRNGRLSPGSQSPDFLRSVIWHDQSLSRKA